MTNNDYVKSSDWERDKRKIDEKINKVDNKHSDNYHLLLSRIEVQTVLQKNTYETQKRSEEHLESISKSIGEVGSRVSDLEYANKSNEKEIGRIQKTIDEKTKGNTSIIVAWIGVAGIVLPTLIPMFANLFK